MARGLGLSLRQFERRFQATVGLRPKVFCRIQRFNRISGMLEQPVRSWADTAAACGYYDQAHLIRDCRSLTGTVPARLLAEDSDLARYFYRGSGVSRLYKTGAGVTG
jgi:transcriptional regulator GlxA family with amidase domain